MNLVVVFRLVMLLIAVAVLAELPGETRCQGRSEPYESSYNIWDLQSMPDSAVDIDRYLHTLDTMAAAIQYMVGPRDGDMVRFVMAKMYQFEPGEWNNSRVFSYDLDDPLGEKPRARLLTTYLDTHKGNCVSMPTLFLALMERVDFSVPFWGVAAPLYLFCRLHDREGEEIWNVESTNGGYSMREEWVVERFGITQVATAVYT